MTCEDCLKRKSCTKEQCDKVTINQIIEFSPLGLEGRMSSVMIRGLNGVLYSVSPSVVSTLKEDLNKLSKGDLVSFLNHRSPKVRELAANIKETR